jgi:23S rRNA (uracil747-C5)-methyltransferase
VRCSYYEAGTCRSCTLLEQPYPEQVADKDARARELVGGSPVWLPPVTGPEAAFRNKAKMVVGGTVDAPTLGILDADGRGVDLQGCGLHTPGLRAALPVLARFVTTARLTPYDVVARTGELKHLLVTESPDGELMVRFVLRSTEAVPRIRKHLPPLLAELPVAVASVNLLREPRAVLEGPEEILLVGDTLTMHVGVPLRLRPQGFFQTNTVVAAALYRQAADWVAEAAPRTVWDLYCGVGGFALHCSAPGRRVLGVELSDQAVAAADRTRRELGLEDVEFRAGDATAFALGASDVPDLVVVNPPRRGLGPDLSGWLESSGVAHVVYSSCNVESLARDLAAMPSLAPLRAQVFDLFPQTSHHETLVLLARS